MKKTKQKIVKKAACLLKKLITFVSEKKQK
jgi:hypothetical protein